MNMPWLKVVATLLLRELREHRLLFLYVPLACTLLAMAGFTLWLVQIYGPPESFMRIAETATFTTPEDEQLFAEYFPARVAEWYTPAVQAWYVTYESMLLVAFWGSMAFYYLFTLYQTRKDRSILFWNSLPISDAQTIASKLLAGLIACYSIYLLCLAALELFMLLAVRAWVGFSGAQGFTEYLNITGPFDHVLTALILMPVNLLWCLPAYGWLLLASAWSREAPFAWATGPWVIVILAELALTDKSLVFNKIFEHLLPLDYFKLNDGVYPEPELALGAALGTALIFAAVRFNRSDAN